MMRVCLFTMEKLLNMICEELNYQIENPAYISGEVWVWLMYVEQFEILDYCIVLPVSMVNITFLIFKLMNLKTCFKIVWLFMIVYIEKNKRRNYVSVYLHSSYTKYLVFIICHVCTTWFYQYNRGRYGV